MAEPKILTPAPGSRIVTDDSEVILFGQPPEVLKGLLREGISSFDTLVLPDIREKNGSLLNMRSYHGKNLRAVSISKDGGQSWSGVVLDPNSFHKGGKSFI